MIRINLIPNEFLVKQKKKIQMARLTAAGVFVFLVFAFLTVGHIYAAIKADALLKKKQAQLKKVEDRVKQVRQLEVAKTAALAHLVAVKDIINARSCYPRFMQDIATSMSETVWFSSLHSSINEDGNIDFNVSAMARSGEDVAKWFSTLEKSSKFSEPVIGAISMTEKDNIKKYSFPIKAIYKTGNK